MGAESKSLLEEFYVGTSNPDPGRGLIDFMQRQPDELDIRRAETIAKIEQLGIEFFKQDDHIGARNSGKYGRERGIDKDGTRLLIELSNLNEAVGFSGSMLKGVKSIMELNTKLQAIFCVFLEVDKKHAYAVVDVLIPRIVRFLRISLALEGQISQEDDKNLRELTEFAMAKVNALRNRSDFVMLGN